MSKYYMRRSLLRLPAEMLLEILRFCDAEGVLTLEKTCRTMHILSNSERLWMLQLSKLDYDHAPDVPPHVDLGALGTEEIKKLVVRAIRGYKNWHSPSGPRVISERVFRYANLLFDPLMLLPGCDYMLVRTRSRSSHTMCMFGVWSIEQEMLVSIYTLDSGWQDSSHHCTILKGGNTVRLALLCTTSGDVYDPDLMVVVDLDLVHGRSKVLVSYQHISVPYTDSIYATVEKTKVIGNMVLGWTPGIFTLINVTSGEIARIRDDEYLEVQNFDIVRDTVVYMLCDATFGTPFIYVARVSRIFAHSPVDLEELISLRDVSEAIASIPCVMPTDTTMDDSFICDPSQWGSPLPCRILYFQVGLIDTEYHAQAHRTLLTFDPETSVPVLTPDSRTKTIILRDHDDSFDRLSQTPSGHWLLCFEQRRKYRKWRRFKRFAILYSESSEDNVRVLPLNEKLQGGNAACCKIERYSGTVWYDNCRFTKADGVVGTITLQHFN